MSDQKPVKDSTMIAVLAILCVTLLAALWILFG